MYDYFKYKDIFLWNFCAWKTVNIQDCLFLIISIYIMLLLFYMFLVYGNMSCFLNIKYHHIMPALYLNP